ncbi:unnamed protein product [Calicophoron daubneyi]|uniref:GOLD domain-containing protein n=1 Tax=Calicophoron daubneyi TaxID=300641 RepID=A0AAV2T0U2_CALDB
MVRVSGTFAMWIRVCHFFLVISSCLAYYVEIDAGEDQCYFERVKIGQKLTLHYEVAEGGFRDIDVNIRAPDDSIVHSESKLSSGRPQFVANKDGDYTYCFSNKQTSQTPKVILFEMHVEKDALKPEEKDDEAQKKLVGLFNELSHSVESVKLEMEYVALRTNIHWAVNQNTNFRVVLWAAFEAALIITMSIGQVFYLKRFFEVRRLV